jgi:hypothetical protein
MKCKVIPFIAPEIFLIKPFWTNDFHASPRARKQSPYFHRIPKLHPRYFIMVRYGSQEALCHPNLGVA